MDTIHNIQFPKLNLEFNINPVAFSIGNISVRWYGVIIATGFLLAILYGFKSCKKMNIDVNKLIDVIIVGVIGGIVGARLFYVLFNDWEYYRQNPLEILKTYNGGLAFYGGLIGALLLAVIMMKIRKMRIPAVLDLVGLGFLIGQAVGRWGNFVNQEAFGGTTDLPWGMTSDAVTRFLTFEGITPGPVHPCFLYESILCLIGFIALHIFTRKYRRYDGQTFILYIMWYGICRFFIESLRTDSLYTFGGNFKVSMLIGGASFVVGLILLIVFRKKTTLSGCGNKKIMEMNIGVYEDNTVWTDEKSEKKFKKTDKKVEESSVDKGYSTIFGDLDKDKEKITEGSDSEDKDSLPKKDVEEETDDKKKDEI